MKKALSLLLFVLIALGMSMPLYAGELSVLNSFNVSMFNGDRGVDSQLFGKSSIETRGSYSSEPGFSINWWLEAMNRTWGYEDTSEDSEFNWKVLYGKWESERFSVQGGYLDLVFGNGHTLQADGLGGIILDLNATKATTISLLATLADENGDDYIDDDYDEDGDATENDDGAWLSDEDGEEDTWYFGIQVAQKIENGNVGLYYLTSQDFSNATDDFGALGAYGNLDYKGISFTGETTTYFGDDISGLIATVGGTMPASDNLTVEANLYYGQGSADSDDTVKVEFVKRGMQLPLNKGLGTFDHNDDFMMLLTKFGTNFFSINGGGIYGANLSGTLKTSQQTSLSAGIVFGIPETDADDADWANLVKLNTGITHAVSKSLTLGLSATYMQISDTDTLEEDMWGTAASMTWSF
jgi:hypothetical protein